MIGASRVNYITVALLISSVFSSLQIALGFERKFWGEATKEADLFGRVSRTPTVRGLFDVFYDLSRPQVRWIMSAISSFIKQALSRQDLILLYAYHRDTDQPMPGSCSAISSESNSQPRGC